MYFHYEESLLFINELKNTEATSWEEAAVLNEIIKGIKTEQTRYGKAFVILFALYFIKIGVKSYNVLPKIFSLFVIISSYNLAYDLGSMFSFYFKGPWYFKALWGLKEDTSFSKIQTDLFFRVAAREEIKKAIDRK